MKKKPSWRDVLEVHPCAAVFPEATPEEMRALKKSIRESSLREGVILWDIGPKTYLLDGRSRLDALEQIGRNVLIDGKLNKDYIKDQLDSMSTITAAQLVIAENIRRRHLTPKQRADLAVAAIAAEKAMKKGITGKHFPVIGEQHNPPKQKGKRGSVKGDVAEVAEMAGVSKPTARAAVKRARGEKSKPKKKPGMPELKFWKTLDQMDHADLIKVRSYIDELLKTEAAS
jgi:hypothetical protein